MNIKNIKLKENSKSELIFRKFKKKKIAQQNY